MSSYVMHLATKTKGYRMNGTQIGSPKGTITFRETFGCKDFIATAFFKPTSEGECFVIQLSTEQVQQISQSLEKSSSVTKMSQRDLTTTFGQNCGGKWVE